MPPVRKRSIGEAGQLHSADSDKPYPPPDEFVNADATQPLSKKRAPLSSRTGQACDRCKARKIRCDDTIGGCMPCRQNNTECTTTDRITNRAQVRGHTEALEQEAAVLRRQVQDLQGQLKENNIEPKLPSAHQPWTSQDNSRFTHNEGGQPGGSDHDAKRAANEANVFATMQGSGRRGAVADNYLGISSAHGALGALSHIKGTILSVFGMEVDLAEFVSDDVVDRQYSCMTYDNLQTQLYFNAAPVVGNKPPAGARLPGSYKACMENARAYFEHINPWTPVLHKSDFYKLVDKFYQPDFKPNAAETVMMHMVLAILKFQHAIRNSTDLGKTDDIREQSFAHYNWALQHFPHLIQHPNLRTMQAMTLICAHLRSFPKPGAAWMMTHWTMAVLLDQNLHRSAAAMGGAAAWKLSREDAEMRKRVFWSVLAMRVSLSGKLGRPIELRREDFDIEIPNVLNDNVPEDESAGPPHPRCSFRTAIETFKLVRLFLDTYNAIYALHPTPDYEDTLHTIERQHDEVKNEMTEYQAIAKSENIKNPDYVFALWVQFWNAELTITLHHPAVCRSSNPEVLASNLQKCVKASLQIIETVAKLRTVKSLDATWLNATTYIAAAFTLLFAYWGRRDYVSPNDIVKLKKDLDVFIDILHEVGRLLGTGKELPNRIKAIVDTWLSKISRYMSEKTASAIVATPGMKQERSQIGMSAPGPTTLHRGSFALQAPQTAAVPNAPGNAFSGHESINPSPTDYHPAMHSVLSRQHISQPSGLPFDPYAAAPGSFAAGPQYDGRSSLFTNPETYYPHMSHEYAPMQWQSFTRTLKEDPSIDYQQVTEGLNPLSVPAVGEPNMSSPLPDAYNPYPNQNVSNMVQQTPWPSTSAYDPLRDQMRGHNNHR